MKAAPLHHPTFVKPLKARPLCSSHVTSAAGARQPLHNPPVFSNPRGKDLVDLSVVLDQLKSSTSTQIVYFHTNGQPKTTSLWSGKKIAYAQEAADAIQKNLCRPSVHDPYRLSFCEVESLIDCLVSLHALGLTSPDLGMHALATMACFHESRKSGPPKDFRNSVRWLQRKELGYSIRLLPTDIHSLAPNMSLLRLLWAASLMFGPSDTQKVGEKPHQVPGYSQKHSWADHEVTTATAKLAADVLTPQLMRQAQIEDKQSKGGKPGSKVAMSAACHLGITSPKLEGLAFLCHSSARFQATTHEPLGLISQLLFCIDTSIDNRLNQILSSLDDCNESELDELAQLSNLMTKTADKAV